MMIYLNTKRRTDGKKQRLHISETAWLESSTVTLTSSHGHLPTLRLLFGTISKQLFHRLGRYRDRFTVQSRVDHQVVASVVIISLAQVIQTRTWKDLNKVQSIPVRSTVMRTDLITSLNEAKKRGERSELLFEKLRHRIFVSHSFPLEGFDLFFSQLLVLVHDVVRSLAFVYRHQPIDLLQSVLLLLHRLQAYVMKVGLIAPSHATLYSRKDTRYRRRLNVSHSLLHN